MRYDAIFLYANKDADTHGHYQFPPRASGPPGDNAVEVAAAGQRGKSISVATKKKTIYKMSDSLTRTCLGKAAKGERVNAVKFTSGDKDAHMIITDEELESLKDEHGYIRFYKVVE